MVATGPSCVPRGNEREAKEGQGENVHRWIGGFRRRGRGRRRRVDGFCIRFSTIGWNQNVRLVLDSSFMPLG
jgi:hypothetical protein